MKEVKRIVKENHEQLQQIRQLKRSGQIPRHKCLRHKLLKPASRGSRNMNRPITIKELNQ